MTDHTEREREARMAVAFWGPDPWVAFLARQRNNFENDLDAYRAAVRAAVLAEVREKVERYMDEGCGCGCDADDHADAFNGILAALTALEATDGR